MTPLQKLLQDRTLPERQVQVATGKSRTTVWRWREGVSYPERAEAEALILLFTAHGYPLDYNGCYPAPEEA